MVLISWLNFTAIYRYYNTCIKIQLNENTSVNRSTHNEDKVKKYSTNQGMRGSRNFVVGGGGGGSRPICQEKATCMTTFFSLQLILQKSNGYFEENYNFSRFQRGSNIFQGWMGVSNFFKGVQLLIPYRNPYNL